MRKLLLVIMAVAFISCEKDDLDETPVPEARIIGEWEVFKLEKQDQVNKKNESDLRIYSDDQLASEYGRGFTICRNISSDNADREDIIKKIKNNFFDLVVYGSIWRCQDYIDVVLESYTKDKIVYVDGEDSNGFSDRVKDRVIYFKRELYPDPAHNLGDLLNTVLPIQFAFPTNKVSNGVKKERRIAHSDPRDKKTYIFNSENDYYRDYQFSKFAITQKKAGWDCLRHYEIMGNGCIPLFPEIMNCPRFVMMRFPKALMTKIAFFEKNEPKWLEQRYEYFHSEMMDHFNKYNTKEPNLQV